MTRAINSLATTLGVCLLVAVPLAHAGGKKAAVLTTSKTSTFTVEHNGDADGMLAPTTIRVTNTIANNADGVPEGMIANFIPVQRAGGDAKVALATNR